MRRKMQPIAPLMIEHRLIEKMIASMRKEMERLEKERTANPALIEVMVDFIRTYADRCHHGKEEDILFRELGKKNISREHHAIMEELIDDHIQARRITAALVEARDRYVQGMTKESVPLIVNHMRTLVEFYPKHIEKEDRRFFIPAMEYFSQKEKDAILQEGFEFDQDLIHKKYQDVLSRVREILGD